MPKTLRVVATLAVPLLIAFACSKPKEQVTQSAAESKGGSALDDVKAPTEKEKAEQGGSLAPKEVAVNGPAAKGYAALNPAADAAQARKIGQLVKLRSTSYDKPNTWTGVTKDTIKLAFNIDETNCGVNIVQLAVAAGAATAEGDRFYRPSPGIDQDKGNAEQDEAIKLLVRYWNDHIGDVAQDFPQAVEVMKKYNTPGHQFYGRKLNYSIVDGGSFQCPEKQTSAAVAIANQIKPFSVVTFDVPGLIQSGYNLSAEMHAKSPATSRPMHFGLIDTSDKYLKQWAPFVWNEFQSITKMSRLSSTWICARLKGKKAVNAHTPAYKNMARKFALLYPNNPNANQAANEFKGFLKSDCGLTFTRNVTEFQFNDNPARAADEGTTIAVRLKQAQVTSVIYLIDFLGALFHIIAFDNQDYRPEFIWNGTGAQTNTVQRAFEQSMVDRASIGYTSFGIQGFGFGPGDAFWVYHTYHKVSPKTKKACDPRSEAGMLHDPEYCRAPGAIVAWYYSWLPLAIGMVLAGPNLTPTTVSAGLQTYPLTRYGIDGPTDDPLAVLVGPGPGQYYFITDGSEFRWRSDYVSPPPESLLGFPDFPDCQRHYLSWLPEKLATLWEKSGPNYNKYCGNAKYASVSYRGGVPYEPRKDSESTCAEDTVSGKCETDNYPRWDPVLYR